MKKAKRTPPQTDGLEPGNPEEAAMFEQIRRGDFVGRRYAQAAKLRRKRKLSKSERDFLKAFDADRKRILRDPESVCDEGFHAVHRGLVLLESLIHEQHLQGIAEREDLKLSDAVCCLSLLAVQLRDDLIRYAEDGWRFACQAIFQDGKALANAFSRLAITYPEHFREIAERSLTMPSLRARNPVFTCDAQAIIRAIHLAEKHHASNLHDNRSRLGALCHQFVAEIVDLLEAARLEVIASGRQQDRLYALPELRGNVAVWWRRELKEWVGLEFQKMRTNPRRNPGLWQELENATAHGTDAAKRAALEKYCFNKLAQIAGKPASPAPQS